MAPRWCGCPTRPKASLRKNRSADKFRSDMRSNLTTIARAQWLAALLVLFAYIGAAAQAGELKFRAYLVWATNAERPPDTALKPVESDVRRKLEELPLKWSNYFEVNRTNFTVLQTGLKEVTLSAKCQIVVKDVDGKNVEVSLIGKGKPVLKRIQPLPMGQMLVLGGNAPNSTGWLVVLRRVK